MSGKINASNLSAPSLQALRAERQEGAKNNSFWDKWSNLSTGQKWGRALAWLIPPLGIGLQAGANLWQGRQAKAAAARPGESRIALSEAKIGAYPLRGSVVFGKADRDMAREVLAPDLNKTLSVIQQGDQAYSAEMVALPTQFALDLDRLPDHRLQSQNGKNTVQIMPTTDKAMRPGAFRDFFRQEFPGNSNKADQWAIFAAKFLNQNASAPFLTVTSKRHGYVVPNDYASYNLKMENGGNSALVEIRAKGHPNKIQGIDSQKSTVDNFLLMRITLGPPEDLTVLSGYANHELVPEQISENSEVESDAPVPQPANEELITSSRASSLLQQFALGMIKPGRETYMPLQRYKDHLAAQDSPDLTAFKAAFDMLDTPQQKQNLIGELVSVIKDKDPSSYSSQIEEGSELGQLLSENLNELKSQENLKDIQGMKNILNAAGIHSVNDLVKIDNRKNAADSITLDQEKIINNNFLGGGNILFKGFYDRPELLGEGVSTQERGDFYRPLLEAGDTQTLQIQLAEKQQMLDNGDINNDFFESYKINQQVVQDTTREERLGKDLDNLNAPEKRALLRKYITTAKSNNLTATEAMQVLRGLGAYHKADATEVKDQVSMVLSDQTPTKQKLENLKSLFPLMSS